MAQTWTAEDEAKVRRLKEAPGSRDALADMMIRRQSFIEDQVSLLETQNTELANQLQQITKTCAAQSFLRQRALAECERQKQSLQDEKKVVAELVNQMKTKFPQMQAQWVETESNYKLQLAKQEATIQNIRESFAECQNAKKECRSNLESRQNLLARCIENSTERQRALFQSQATLEEAKQAHERSQLAARNLLEQQKEEFRRKEEQLAQQPSPRISLYEKDQARVYRELQALPKRPPPPKRTSSPKTQECSIQ